MTGEIQTGACVISHTTRQPLEIRKQTIEKPLSRTPFNTSSGSFDARSSAS